MSPSRRRSQMTCLCLAAGLLGLSPAWGQDEAKLKQQGERLAEVRTRIQQVQKAMEGDQRQMDSTQKQLQALEQGIATQQSSLRTRRAEIAQQTRRVQQADQDLKAAERQLRAQKSALGRQLRAAYITGEHEQTQLLLNLDRLTQLSRMLTYYDYLNRSRIQRMSALHALGEKLQALIAQARDEVDRLDRLKQAQEKSLAMLEASRVERQQLLAQIAQRLNSAAGRLQSLKESESSLTRLIDRLRDSLADIPMNLGRGKTFAQLKGRLPWPVRGKLLASFGASKNIGRLNWNGIWIAAEEGTPVRAIARGRVAYTGWMRRYGLIALLEHEGGFFSLYGHSQTVSVEDGEWVEGGAVIASAGATGGHDASGVYLEVRKGSQPVNPRDWLKKTP